MFAQAQTLCTGFNAAQISPVPMTTRRSRAPPMLDLRLTLLPRPCPRFRASASAATNGESRAASQHPSPRLHTCHERARGCVLVRTCMCVCVPHGMARHGEAGGDARGVSDQQHSNAAHEARQFLLLSDTHTLTIFLLLFFLWQNHDAGVSVCASFTS